MNTNIVHREIAAGYAVAGLTLCLGVYFGMKVDGDAGATLVRGFYLLAGVIVLKYTFAWGRARGFPARKDDGSISTSNVLRNFAMAIIVSASLSLLIAPIVMLAFKFAR